MDNQEAIASLKTLCHNCELFPKCAYEKPECFKAIELAISALQAQEAKHSTESSKTQKALDTISRQAVKYKLDALVNEFEEILSHIREREVNDSVCGLCEYDGAYIGQSGDWCNECPGFEKDDCFKLKEKYRKEWTDILPPERITEALTDIGRAVAIVRDEFEEALRKAVEQCKI